MRLSAILSHAAAHPLRTRVLNGFAMLQCVGLAEFSPARRQQLTRLIERYAGNMDDGHALVKMAGVEGHLDNNWFAWIGSARAEGVFFRRKHSTRQHIHVAVRRGNPHGA